MNHKPFVLILARGGSKRIPNKNLQLLSDNVTLLSNTIAIAQGLGVPVHVSSDSPHILLVAEKHDALAISRPPALATDTASSVDAALHAVDKLLPEEKQGSIILLQCTQPFLSQKDIERAYTIHCETGSAIFGAKRTTALLQSWSENCPLYPQFQGVRSQDLPPLFLPAGSFFITKIKDLRKTKSFFKPKAQPFALSDIVVDIDTPEDLKYARFLWRQRQLAARNIKQYQPIQTYSGV